MKKVKVFSTVLIVVVLFSTLVLCFVGCGVKENDVIADNESEFLSMTVDNCTDKLLLSASNADISSGQYIEKTLTATVLPADLPAEQKKVNWSVSWEGEGNVSDYLTVASTSTYGETASVKVHQPFVGTIIVHATTEVGGYTAICACTYVGVPTTLSVNVTEETCTVGTVSGVYLFGENQTYTFDLIAENVFGDCADEYKVFDVILSSPSKFKVADCDNYGNYSDAYMTWDLDQNLGKFVSAQIVDGKLQIVTKYRVESYQDYYDGTTHHHKFMEWVETDPRFGANGVFYVQISCEGCLPINFYFSIGSAVTGVVISNTSLEF